MLVLACLALGAQAQLLLSTDHVSLAGGIDLLLDPASTLSIEEVAQPAMATRFQRLPGEPNLGYVSGAAWLRFTLTRPASSAAIWWLELNSGLIDEVKLYFPTADGGWTHSVAGDTQPWSRRDMSYPTPTFKLELPADRPVTMYLRLYSMATLSFSLKAWTTEAFVSSSNMKMLALGVEVGVYLVLILSNIWFFQATRESSYLLFSLYVLMNGLSGLAADGLLYQYFLRDWPQTNGFIQVESYFLTLPIAGMFFLQYLGLLTPQRPRWVMMFIILSWTIALGASAFLWVSEPRWLRPAYLLWLVSAAIVFCITMVYLAWHGNQAARQLLLATTFGAIATLMRLGRNSGLLQPNLFTDSLTYVGAMMYLLTVNYGLSRHYQNAYREKKQAQAKALQIAQESQHELEKLVAVRTQALQEALMLVESSLNAERQALKDQRSFFSTISHELRTPLAVIDATTNNLMLDGQSLDGITRRRYDKLQRATEQLVVLVKNCFHEDRFELLNRGSQRQSTDLNELLFDAHKSVVLQSQHHDIRIDADDLPEDFPCDPELTRLALRTLVANAIKYTPPGTQVRLRGRLHPTGVILEVIDNGPGVCAEDLPRLFERYYRGKHPTTVPGTGLGLPLARELIQMQGGSLLITSLLGEEFRATIWLPSCHTEGNCTDLTPEKCLPC